MTLSLLRVLIRLLEHEERRTGNWRDTDVLCQARRLLGLIEMHNEARGPKEKL